MTPPRHQHRSPATPGILLAACALLWAGAAGAGLDCSKLKKKPVQEFLWSAPDHTLSSERFDIYWGDKRSAQPWKDFPANHPQYLDPREILKTAEAFWTKAIDEMQLYRAKHWVPRDRIRIVCKGTWKKWRDKPDDLRHYAIGGGLTEGEGDRHRFVGGHVILGPPRTAMNKGILTHELTHVLQTYAACDRKRPRGPGPHSWKSFGMTHESHASFIPILIPLGEPRRQRCFRTLSTKHLRPGQPRPYQNWTWMLFLCEKEDPTFFCRVYEDHTADGVHPFEVIKHRKKLGAGAFADYWFEHAQRNVTGDYKIPNVRDTIREMRRRKTPLTVGMRPVAGKPKTFEPPAESVPQRFGYNHVLLHPVGRKAGKPHTIRAMLKGGSCTDTSADWRFGFCVIARVDKPRYVGPARAGRQAAVTLAPDDKRVTLVVMATPGALPPFDRHDPADEDVPRYFYTVRIDGARPDLLPGHKDAATPGR